MRTADPEAGFDLMENSEWCAAKHRRRPLAPAAGPPSPMATPLPKEIIIRGITNDGRPFRPSDWAERLAGVMSPFRPGGVQPGSHLSYSPWCVARVMDGVKCVIVNSELRQQEL